MAKRNIYKLSEFLLMKNMKWISKRIVTLTLRKFNYYLIRRPVMVFNLLFRYLLNFA